MMPADKHTHVHLIECKTADEAIAYLCNGFLDADKILQHARVVHESDVPDPFRRLLVHHDHMTTTLRDYHDAPIGLSVLDHELTDDTYTRKIILTLAGSPATRADTPSVVEFGIVRIDLAQVPDVVRSEILQRTIPLGDILIQHDILREIEPKWYLAIDPPSPLLKHFDKPLSATVYGRIGIIHCNGSPAIQLLEVVCAAKRQAAPLVTDHQSE